MFGVQFTDTDNELDNELAYLLYEHKGGLGDIRSLLKAGADPNARFVSPDDNSRCTLFHRAIRNCEPEIAELMLAYGADVQVTDEDGFYPIHTAAKLGSRERMEILMEAGADIASVNPYGNTVLHCASNAADLKRFEYALSLGANPHQKNAKGKLPEDYARSKSVAHMEMVKTAIRNAKPLPQLKDRETLSKASLFAKAEDKCLLDHPSTWHEMWDILDETLSRDDLLKTDAKGRSWLARGIECRQFERMRDMLAEQGEDLTDAKLWVEKDGSASHALNAMVRKFEVGKLFELEYAQKMPLMDMKKIYQALPPQGREQVDNYHQLIATMTIRQQQMQEHGR